MTGLQIAYVLWFAGWLITSVIYSHANRHVMTWFTLCSRMILFSVLWPLFLGLVIYFKWCNHSRGEE